jgi:serine/threonine-protein kinase
MSESSPPTAGSANGPGVQLVGTTISGRYKVESLLGTGGMGSVYLVQHTHMRKRFALKILNSQTAQVPEMVARFEREAMAAAHVEHPNITVAIDFGKAEDGAFFLVLEYLEGQRLRDAMEAGPIEIRRALHIARQVASALERSHVSRPAQADRPKTAQADRLHPVAARHMFAAAVRNG